jgi:hypothetical protein
MFKVKIRYVQVKIRYVQSQNQVCLKSKSGMLKVKIRYVQSQNQVCLKSKSDMFKVKRLESLRECLILGRSFTRNYPGNRHHR